MLLGGLRANGRPRKKYCTQWRTHTDKQTDGHGDSMTESAQWGRFSENYLVDEVEWVWSRMMRPLEPSTIMKPAVKPSTMYCWFIW